MQEYIDYALVVILQRFGELGHAVAKSLAYRGNQTIPELTDSTNLDIEIVCQGLTALLQHDLVICAPPRSYPKPKVAAGKAGKAPAKKKRVFGDDDDELENDEEIEGDIIVTTPTCHSATTSLFGCAGAGYVEYTAETRPKRAGVYHPVLPTKVEALTNSGVVKKYTYSLNFDLVRGLTRQPEYLAVVERLYGAREARFVLEEFCIRGKLTIQQAVTACVDRLERDAEYQAQDALETQETEHTLTAEDLEGMDLAQLVALPTSVLAAARMSGTDTLTDKLNTVEAKKDASVRDRVRRAFEWLLHHHFLTQTRGFVDDASANVSNIAKLAKKRKVEDDELFGSSSSTSSQSVSYVINHDRFTFFLRNEACARYVAKRVSAVAGVIVGAILHAIVTEPSPRLYYTAAAAHTLTSQFAQLGRGRNDETSQWDGVSQPTTYEEALDFVHANKLMQADVDNWLQQLCHPHIDIAGRRMGHVVEYYINAERLCQNTRLEYAYAFVVEHCGKLPARIFRLLCDKTRLEEKQVSDMALISRKDTKEYLYLLQTANFVELQDIPRTADRQPSKSFFVWSLAHNRLKETMLGYFYRVYRNTLLRLMAETSASQTTLDKLNAKMELTDSELTASTAWAGSFLRCENVLRAHTLAILLFHDVCQ